MYIWVCTIFEVAKCMIAYVLFIVRVTDVVRLRRMCTTC